MVFLFYTVVTNYCVLLASSVVGIEQLLNTGARVGGGRREGRMAGRGGRNGLLTEGSPMLSTAVPVKYRTSSSLTDSPGNVEMSRPRFSRATVRTILEESDTRFRNTGVSSRMLA